MLAYFQGRLPSPNSQLQVVAVNASVLAVWVINNGILMIIVCFSLVSSFQQRLSYNTLSDLALALIDGTVYEIVQGLLDIQHLTEKNLYNQRQKLHCEHQGWCSA